MSPYEEVSATFCPECQHVADKLSELVDAAAIAAQGVLQLNTLRRFRRVEQVTYELMRRRIFSAFLAKASWEEIADALGMMPHEAKEAYGWYGEDSPST